MAARPLYGIQREDKLIALVLALLVFAAPARAEDAPSGRFEEAACRECHVDTATGAHEAIACVKCHGGLHEDTASMARTNTTCMDCHGGPMGSVGRSYLTSKHGVIAVLEGPPRAPTCAHCHVRSVDHDDDPAEVCLECHSPRYVETLAETARRALEIGRMKVAEAEAVAHGAEAAALLEKMKNHTFRDLLLGFAHDSPDFQWWHGQAALDGDLLRIKAAARGKEKRP